MSHLMVSRRYKILHFLGEIVIFCIASLALYRGISLSGAEESSRYAHRFYFLSFTFFFILSFWIIHSLKYALMEIKIDGDIITVITPLDETSFAISEIENKIVNNTGCILKLRHKRKIFIVKEMNHFYRLMDYIDRKSSKIRNSTIVPGLGQFYHNKRVK